MSGYNETGFEALAKIMAERMTGRKVEEELKPCPFCGCQLIKLSENLYQHPKSDCWESSAYVDGDKAIEAWNRREGEKE